MSTELAIRDGQEAFNPKQLAALKSLGVSQSCTPADLAVFFHQSVRTGLDPFLRQIYLIGRKSKVNGQWVEKQTIQTGIDGFRLIARRAVDKRKETLGYEDTVWCGEDGLWRDVWLAKEPPLAAKVVVLRDGQPFSAVALMSEYVQMKDDKPVSQWATRPTHMIAKCAEALALRKAFPQDLSGLYTDDETGLEVPDGPVVVEQGTRRMSRTVSPETSGSVVEQSPVGEAQMTPTSTTDPDPEVEGQAAMWPEVPEPGGES